MKMHIKFVEASIGSRPCFRKAIAVVDLTEWSATLADAIKPT